MDNFKIDRNPLSQASSALTCCTSPLNLTTNLTIHPATSSYESSQGSPIRPLFVPDFPGPNATIANTTLYPLKEKVYPYSTNSPSILPNPAPSSSQLHRRLTEILPTKHIHIFPHLEKHDTATPMIPMPKNKTISIHAPSYLTNNPEFPIGNLSTNPFVSLTLTTSSSKNPPRAMRLLNNLSGNN